MTHTGDNWRDHAYSFIPCNFLERPRHVSLAIGYLLSAWPGYDNIEPGPHARSATRPGGFTVFVAIRGTPGIRSHDRVCPDQPDDRGCRKRLEKAWSRDSGGGTAEAIWVHDSAPRGGRHRRFAAGYAVVENGGKRPAVT